MRLAVLLGALATWCACGSSSSIEALPTPATGTAGPTPSGANLCAGLVQDRDARGVPPLARPAARTPLTDPVFGTRIVRISEASPREGEDAIVKPLYSTIQAWNADESLLVLWHRQQGHELYDGRTYQFLRRLPLESPTDIEQLFWDPIDPDILYYPSNHNAEPRLMRFRVSRNGSEVVRDFRGTPTDCGVGWDRLLTAGSDPLDMSWGPERVIGLRCGQVRFLYSISSDKVSGVGRDSGKNAPAPTFDGRLAFYEGKVLDAALQPQRELRLANRYEHASLARGATGALFGAVDFDGSPAGSLVVHDMQTGEKKPVIAESTGWPYPPSGTHISGIARSGPPGWFALSVVGDPSRPCLLCQELLLANADDGTVCRVAHHRSWAGEGKWGYWAEPHLVLSPSGTRLLFGSDWGNGTTVDTFVVELPSYKGATTAR